MIRAAVGINQKVSSHTLDCPLLYIIAHTSLHASYLLRRTSPLYLYYKSSALFHTRKLSCIWPFITLVYRAYLYMTYTSYIRPLRASLYYATDTTTNMARLPYSKKSMLHSSSMKCLTTLRTRLLLCQMMVRSLAKHITFIAFTLKLLAPPKVHTTFQNWLKVRISWGNSPRYRLHIFDQFLSEFAFRFLKVQAVSVESPRAQ